MDKLAKAYLTSRKAKANMKRAIEEKPNRNRSDNATKPTGSQRVEVHSKELDTSIGGLQTNKVGGVNEELRPPNKKSSQVPGMDPKSIPFITKHLLRLADTPERQAHQYERVVDQLKVKYI
jgi:hypothetical protein